MSDLTISDDLLGGIKDKVIFITGGASGIGKATAELCFKHGAKVIIGNINPPHLEGSELERSDDFKFLKVDVCSWDSLRDAFKQVEEWFGRIDHVFANAGVGPTTDFVDEKLDESGQLAPPNMRTINVNLIGVIYTLRLAAYHIQKHSTGRAAGETGSLVVNASASSFHNFCAGDYTVAKHGVLGIVRGMGYQLDGKVRLNAVAPSWTATKLVPTGFIEALGVPVQGPEVVARSVALLFADQRRHGEVLYSWDGKYREVNKGDDGFLAASYGILGNPDDEDTVMRKVKDGMAVAGV